MRLANYATSQARGDVAVRRLVGILGSIGVLIFVGLTPLRFPRFYAFCQYITCSHPRLTPELLPQLEAFGLTRTQFAAWFTGLEILVGLVWIGAGVIIYLRARQKYAVLVSLMLIGMGSGYWTTDGPWIADLPLFVAIPQTLLGYFSVVFLFLAFCLFPDGRFEPRWSRWIALLFLPVGAAFYPTPDKPYAFNGWPPVVQAGVVSAFVALGICAQIYRYRRISGYVERQQAKWFMGGLAATMLFFVPFHFALSLLGLTGIAALMVTGTASYLAMMILPVAIVFAVLRHRLWEIDLLISRTLVYTLLTVAVAAIYALVVGALGLLFQTRGNFWISMLGTGLVAVLFQPLRERLQYWVNRLRYGDRDDPYQAFSRLGRRLEAAMAPEQVLPSIVATVGDALRLPYAAISLRSGEEFTTAAEVGSPPAEPLTLPLVYQSEVVGQLVVGPRAADDPFTGADRLLLEDLARQAGVAVHGVRLNADLRRSRERLVTAIEEERRRLRRDLHDGLGPRLAALGLKIGSARVLGQYNPAAVDGVLAELESDLESTLADIRRLVYNLRPPALDQLGLIGALRETVAQYQSGSAQLRFRLEAPDHLPPLPAAVEVAAYRIAQEALTNTIRHAQASVATIRLLVDDHNLCLAVEDDGRGLAPSGRAGVGLTSMRERAVEVGGALKVASRSDGGTLVTATLPLSLTQSQTGGE